MKTLNYQFSSPQKKTMQIYFEVVIIFIFLYLSVLMVFIFNTLNSMDEIWNYQFARRILNDQIPYRDFYMLQAPFAAQINATFLYLFSDKLIILRAVGAFVTSLIGITYYLILRICGKNMLLSFLTVCLFMCLVFSYPENNYSWYAILFLSCALLIEIIKIKNYNNKIILEILIGILLGFATISKQNIGVFGLFASIVFEAYYIIFLNNGLNNKFLKYQLIKDTALKIFGWSIVVGIELFYLKRYNAMDSMIDQTIISARTFIKYCYQPYSYLLFDYSISVKLLSIIVPSIIFLLFINGLLNKDPKNKALLILIFFYSMVNFSMIFPLADLAHLIFSSPIPLLSCILLFPTNNVNMMRIYYVNNIFILIIVSAFLIFLIYFSNKPHSNYFDHNINHYEMVPVSQNMVNNLNYINKLIINLEQQGNQVHFLDYRAAFYLIPLNKFNFKSDTMFIGNIGSKGEEEIIKMLATNNNNVILLNASSNLRNRQQNISIEHYVRYNMEHIGVVKGFDVFTNISNNETKKNIIRLLETF